MGTLRYTILQGNELPPSKHYKHGNGHSIVKIDNRPIVKTYQKYYCGIGDGSGNEVLAVNRSVVEGITTPIISLTQLINEG